MSFQFYPFPVEKIPLLHGNFAENVVDYFSTFERISRANGWDAVQMSQVLPAFLRQYAAEVFESLDGRTKTSYALLKRTLVARLAGPPLKHLFVQHLNNRKQQRSESVGAFASAIRELTFKSYPDFNASLKDHIALENFMCRLQPSLRRLTSLSAPRSFRTAVEKAVEQ